MRKEGLGIFYVNPRVLPCKQPFLTTSKEDLTVEAMHDSDVFNYFNDSQYSHVPILGPFAGIPF